MLVEILESQKRERVRLGTALDEVRKEQETSIKPQKETRERLLNAKQSADQRAKEVVRLHRLKASTEVPNVVDLLQPVSGARRRDMDKENLQRGGRVDYTQTRFHRATSLAIRSRLEPGVTTAAGIVDAKKAAEEERELHERRLKELQERQRRNEEKAKGRYRDAITEKYFDKTKDQLCKELNQLRLEDRQRKHQAFDKNAQTFRTAFSSLSKPETRGRFRRQFEIAADVFGFTETAIGFNDPTPIFRRRKYFGGTATLGAASDLPFNSSVSS
ncbi:hypothetical protein HDV05_001433 [Chytridiales sp. JEL 0842]|nr:hypothetical protein HDV05_001433 [Chytridiales sp. JEL 0842]